MFKVHVFWNEGLFNRLFSTRRLHSSLGTSNHTMVLFISTSPRVKIGKSFGTLTDFWPFSRKKSELVVQALSLWCARCCVVSPTAFLIRIASCFIFCASCT